MRNVFDQYKHPENRLTHALITALNEDRKLLKEFIIWVTGKGLADIRRLTVTEQHVPGEEEPVEGALLESRGLPDGWIQNDDGWALLIESKIEATLTTNQLNRHWRTAKSRGLSDITLLAIITDRNLIRCPEWVLVREWREIYEWLGQRNWSKWAKRTTEYMEILEARLTEEEYLKEGTLTKFAGIPFDSNHPYTYLEAKRLMHLLTGELRKKKALSKSIGMDPRGEGRPAITGKSSGRIWDFIPLRQCKKEREFTFCPHLTIGIQADRLLAVVTIPHRLKTEYRRNLLNGGIENFSNMLSDVFKRMDRLCKIEGASPRVELLQRHYRSQSAKPITDAVLEFDLRTAYQMRDPKHSSKRPKTKAQPQWLEATYNVLTKRSSNLQMVVGASFDYQRCKEIHTPKAVDLVTDTWLACKPLLEAIFRNRS